ncbi:MAG TPA: shikimate dehydrogenase [Bacteroidales bacterium]|jgi:shikimate dehydrogenase|nr:shikimate dehydrogenase [Bacteroidales bacterium]HOX75174.1 shikimate dehydrogenase [Bacteroidales bacterium]HPM87926.1 shikimate dehydrogenase [Bacteroidales bacterium]HQM68905.1 shikimate dehydrogenase [Bacteroidales bacterium]
MRKFGLIGYPLGHSFSQKYFAEKFSRENINDCLYDNYPLKHIELLPGLVAGNPELYGLNVTIPHKTAVLKYVDVTEPSVDEIGAANVLKFRRTGNDIEVYGYNTDVTGIRDSLLPYLKGNIRNVLILGTGGSSKAAAWTMRQIGLNVTFVSRMRKGDILSYSDLTEDHYRNTDLIINTTPLGMYPDISTRPDIDFKLLNEKHIIFDFVYNPEYTSFLKAGKERGCTIITGLKMLHSQADRSWEIWNDPEL